MKNPNPIYIDYNTPLSAEELARIEFIDKTLRRYGLVLLNYESQDRHGTHRRLIIDFDTERYKEKHSRQAGAHRSYSGKKIELADLEAEISASSAEDVARKYGISRATLYRRMKEAKETDNVVYI